MMNDKQFKKWSIYLLSGWLGIFALLPFLFILIASFLQRGQDQFFILHFTLKNYGDLFHPLYFHVFIRSLRLALTTTFFCLIIAYPFAYILSRLKGTSRLFLLLLVIIPFWTSSLIRTYAIVAIIQANGLLNHLLLSLGIIHRPLQILYTSTAVIIGLVYSLLPFMILPLYANLEKFDWHLFDAAKDLGANKWQIYSRILIPLTLPGILAGILLVILPAMTMFYIPDILGGARSLLLGNLIKQQFLDAQNWPLGSAVSVMLTLLMSILLSAYWKLTNTKQRSYLL
jgi:spermidine/putrescine transport system permease protein